VWFGLVLVWFGCQSAAAAIIQRCSAEKMVSHFAVPMFSTPDEFLYHFATKRNKLGKGGVPDKQAAARTLLMEWNAGKIPFYTTPPVETERVVGEATIVADWSKEFSIDDVVLSSEKALLDSVAKTVRVVLVCTPVSLHTLGAVSG
jgi:hypothetical protein